MFLESMFLVIFRQFDLFFSSFNLFSFIFEKKTESAFPKETSRILKEGCSRGGGNWGTLRIPREDWGILGKIRGITTPPVKNPIRKPPKLGGLHLPS